MPVEEEPEVTVSTEEVAEQAAEPNADTEPTQAQAEAVDLYALLTAEVGDTDNPQLDELAKTIDAETIRGWDDTTKASYRAVLRQVKAQEAKTAAALAEREAGYTKREAEIAAAAKKVQQQRQAFLDMAVKAPKDPGAAPVADPFTPDGQRALIAHAAQKANAEAWAPVVAEREQVARQNAWAALVEKYPDLSDPKVGGEDGEFDKFFRERNPQLDKGVVALNATDAADLFFNQRDLARLRSQATKAEQARVADRATAARAVGRSAGAGAPDAAQKVVQILKDHGAPAAYAYVEKNPAARDAFVKAMGL